VDTLKYLFVGLLLSVISFVGCAQNHKENSITVDQLREQMKSDSSLIILDVRNEKELTDTLGHIEGIVNIPVQVLSTRLHELDKFKGDEIAVICRSGRRSEIATKLLLNNGFKAENVLGGMIKYHATEKNIN
jgi:rhodanese-related sulfurtransferase